MSVTFILALSFIVCHELDAIRCKEWRIFPGLSLLEDRMGYMVFTLFHLPLFYWVFFQVQAENLVFRLLFDAFMLIHLVLHLLLRNNAKNNFKDWVSWSIIIGAAFFGLLDLSYYVLATLLT